MRDAGGLTGAILQPQQTFAGEEQYPDIWMKAAVLLRGIAGSQYLFDGNKRTGFIAANTFLRLNGIRLRRLPVSHTEVMVRGLAAGSIEVELAAEYLRAARSIRHRIFG